MTSTRTTSPSSFSTAYWATEAPTLPAPTTVILGRPASNVPSLAYRLATEAGGGITDPPAAAACPGAPPRPTAPATPSPLFRYCGGRHPGPLPLFGPPYRRAGDKGPTRRGCVS